MRMLIMAIASLCVSVAAAQAGDATRQEPQASKPGDAQASQLSQAPQSLRTWRTWQTTLPLNEGEVGHDRRGRRRRARYERYNDRTANSNYSGCYNCAAPRETGCGSPCFPVDHDASLLDNVLLDVFGNPCPDCEVIRY